MSKVFVDTNVVLDLLASRQPFAMEGRQLFSMADLGKIEMLASILPEKIGSPPNARSAPRK